MLKRKTALALTLAMLLTLLTPSFAFGADYSGHWAETTIQKWFDGNKLKGYEDGSFRPDSQITRAEYMTMVNNALGYTEKAEIKFSDVKSDDWYYPEVQKAVQAGYLKGYEDNTARPGNKISRQEAALIIARIKNLSDYASGANIFNDVNDIATWARGGVGAAARGKLMIGYEDNTFRPLRHISRAEALVTIDRAQKETTPGAEEPGPTNPGGGGGNGGGGNGGGSVTTQAAIITSLTIADLTTQAAITLSDITTAQAIFTTTSSAITISAITSPADADMAVTVTSPLGTATTMSAVNGVVNIALNELGDYTIELVVSRANTSSINYTDTKYTFSVKKN
ncbi:MAG TPA: hypothetical protein DEF04_04100 [Clostridiales bacterium]|nr:hypothetical protein [Clostridiales bacterium]